MTGPKAMQLIQKSSLHAVNVRSHDHPYSYRISLKTEKKLPHDPSPRPRPNLFRFKRRRSFVYRNAYRYDFTIVGEGTTEEEASRGAKQYEVEIEYLGSAPPSISSVSEMQELLRRLGDLCAPTTYNTGISSAASASSFYLAKDEHAFIDLDL